MPNPFFGLMPMTAGAALRGANIARERLLRPYPQFDAVNTTTNEGESWYNALQIRLQRRFSAGYTLSAQLHLLALRGSHRVPERGRSGAVRRCISSQDVPHRLSVNGIWELPFGRGRRFGADVNGVVVGLHRRLAVPGIYTYQSGFPVGFGNIIFTGDLDDIALSAERADGRPLVQHRRRLQQGVGAAARVERPDVPAAARQRPHRQRQQRRPVAHQEHAGRAARPSQFRFESLNAFNHPLLPGTEHHPDGGGVRHDQRVDAGQLRAAHAGDGEVPLLIEDNRDVTETSQRSHAPRSLAT